MADKHFFKTNPKLHWLIFVHDYKTNRYFKDKVEFTAGKKEKAAMIKYLKKLPVWYYTIEINPEKKTAIISAPIHPRQTPFPVELLSQYCPGFNYYQRPCRDWFDKQQNTLKKLG